MQSCVMQNSVKLVCGPMGLELFFVMFVVANSNWRYCINDGCNKDVHMMNGINFLANLFRPSFFGNFRFLEFDIS